MADALAAVSGPERREGVDVADEEQVDVELLQAAGFDANEDDDDKMVLNIGVPVWREVKRKREDGGEGGVGGRGGLRIKLTTTFENVTPIDDDGIILDEGSENFVPQSKWGGRKGGFEFKRGVRGVGYYRSGVEVTMPRRLVSAAVDVVDGEGGGGLFDDFDFDYESQFVESVGWRGARPTFEFKKGESGLGYYRTKK